MRIPLDKRKEDFNTEVTEARRERSQRRTAGQMSITARLARWTRKMRMPRHITSGYCNRLTNDVYISC